MDLVQKLVMPRRLMIAGLIACAALSVAIAVQTATAFDTVPYVRTVFIYLLLDYIWASVRREFFS